MEGVGAAGGTLGGGLTSDATGGADGTGFFGAGDSHAVSSNSTTAAAPRPRSGWIFSSRSLKCGIPPVSIRRHGRIVVVVAGSRRGAGPAAPHRMVDLAA